MGFFDNFTEKLGNTLRDAAWFVGAPVGAAIDAAKAALPGGDPALSGALKAVTTGFQHGTQILTGAEDPNAPGGHQDNLISGAVKPAMDALEWVYDNAIAQPINTVAITEQRLVADMSGIEDNASVLDLGSAWDRADEKTGGYGGQGTSMGREGSYLSQGVLQALFGTHGQPSRLTDEGQRALNEGSTWADGGRGFDITSGLTDATERLFLDPTIVLGKVSKAVRLSKSIAAIKDPTEIAGKLNQTRDWLFAGFGKRHDQALQFAMAPNRSAGELMAAFPGLGESLDGPSVASVLEQTNKTMRASGKSEEEILTQAKLVTRASMGDADALKEIDQSAAFAKDALAAMQSHRDDLKTASEWAVKYGDRVTPEDVQDAAHSLNLVKDLSLRGERDYLSSDDFIRMTDERLKAVSKDITAAGREAARQQRVKNLFLGTKGPVGGEGTVGIAGSGSDHPLLSSVLGTTGKLERAAARERGETAGMDFVFQSTIWNKGVKYLAPHIYLGQKAFGAYRKMAQPNEINVEDERAPLELDTFLKHSALDPETRLGLVSKLAAAQGKSQRGLIVEQAIQKATESVVKKYKDENPHFTDETEKLVNLALQKEAAKTGARNAAHTQMFTAAKTEDGARADLFVGDDGMATFAPLLETQLTSRYALPDMKRTEHVLRRHANWITDVAEWAKGNRAPDPGKVSEIASRVFDTKAEKFPGLDVRTSNRAQMVNDFVWKSEENAKLLLDGFNHHWKALTLVTRPLAYGARVNTESALRMIATLGPAAYMMHAAPRTFGYATIGTASGARAWFKSHADSLREEELRKGMEKVEDAHGGQTGEKLVKGTDPQYDAMKAEHAGITARLNQYRTGGRQGRRAAYGAFGEAGYKSIQTRAGELPGAFDTAQGRQNRYLISSETSAALLGDGQKLSSKSSQLTNWGYVPNTDIDNHMTSWLHAVNAQLMQSTVGKHAVELLNATGDKEEATRNLAAWATGTPEGRKLMGEMQWTAHDKTAYARRIIGHVDHYLPGAELKKAAAINGRVTQKELEAALPNIEDRPPVHGESIAMDTGRGSLLGERINGVYSKILRWASDASEDQLARHPMYAAVYEQEAKRRAEFLMADPRIESLTGGDIKRLVQDQAHKKARQSIKNYMYDVAATSDLSHFMRFVSPFVKAWEDTMRKWGRIATEDPSVIGRANQIWNAPNALGLVVDENGNPVEHDGILGYTDPKTGKHVSTYILIPSGLTKWIPGASDSQLKISKQSFNLVLQGGLQPGFGPLVSYPVAKIQTAAPQLNDIAKLVNPYGPPDGLWGAMAPSTLKTLSDAINSQSKNHEQDTRRIWAQMLAEYKTDPQKFGGTAPTIDDAAKRAGALGRLKILNRVTQPFPAIFQSPYQLYIDGYRALQERQRSEGHPQGWADDQFVQTYGDTYFPLVQSESKNNAGLGSSAEAVDAAKRYKSLISKYGVEAGQANPTLVRLIVGQEGEGDFNASAHQWQETRDISPASGVKFRTYDNPQEAQANADASLGWLKYRQFMSNLDAMALEQGFKTYADSTELTATRQEFIKNLEGENQAWHVDWSQRDNDRFTRNLQALGEVANSGKFGPMRTDMAGVQQYLALRTALQQDLQANGISEGSQDATPLKQEFTDAVQGLVSSNSQFAEWSYYTFLERDPLLEPVTPVSGTPAAPTDWGIGSP